MILGELSLAEAPGAVLAHTHRLPGRVLRKGLVLDAGATAALAASGYRTVIAARLDPGDVMEDAAAARLAAPLVSPGLEAGPASTGRVNLIAAASGLLRVRAAAVDAINRLDEALTVATLPDLAVVAPRDMVATVKIIPFAVPGGVLAEAEGLAKAVPALALLPFRAMRVGLVLSTLPGLKPSVIEGTIAAMRARVEALGGTLLPPREAAHATAAVAAALTALLDEGAEMLLVAGASATVDRRDVGPAAVVTAGGAIAHFGMPVDPGNLICVGQVGSVPAIVLPGCARSPKQNGIDLVMQRLAAGLPAGAAEIMGMGVGGLIKESDARPLPRPRPRAAPGPVAAIVLAAGQSRRSGPQHKLLAGDAEGVAMIARSVDAALASRARPVVVVVGHREPEIRAALAGRDVVVAAAPDHAAGLSASLRAGLAALPRTAQAAIVCLGDMPLVTGEVLDRLIAAWDRDEGRLAVQPTSLGRPGNPVLFDRALFPRLADITGDAGARALLATMSDELVAVEVGTDAVLRDFDTPDSLAEWQGTSWQGTSWQGTGRAGMLAEPATAGR